MLETPRLLLIPATADHLEAMLRHDDTRLAALLGVLPDVRWLASDLVQEVVPDAGRFLREHPEAAAWWLYFFIEKSGPLLVGVGGFKGAPDAAGMVELGYSIAPDHRRQGYATEATHGMLAFAFAHPQVTLVQAQTLPTPSYSTQILERAGFHFDTELTDPDEGLVWRWQLARPTYLAAAAGTS